MYTTYHFFTVKVAHGDRRVELRTGTTWGGGAKLAETLLRAGSEFDARPLLFGARHAGLADDAVEYGPEIPGDIRRGEALIPRR